MLVKLYEWKEFLAKVVKDDSENSHEIQTYRSRLYNLPLPADKLFLQALYLDVFWNVYPDIEAALRAPPRVLEEALNAILNYEFDQHLFDTVPVAFSYDLYEIISKYNYQLITALKSPPIDPLLHFKLGLLILRDVRSDEADQKFAENLLNEYISQHPQDAAHIVMMYNTYIPMQRQFGILSKGISQKITSSSEGEVLFRALSTLSSIDDESDSTITNTNTSINSSTNISATTAETININVNVIDGTETVIAVANTNLNTSVSENSNTDTSTSTAADATSSVLPAPSAAEIEADLLKKREERKLRKKQQKQEDEPRKAEERKQREADEKLRREKILAEQAEAERLRQEQLRKQQAEAKKRAQEERLRQQAEEIKIAALRRREKLQEKERRQEEIKEKIEQEKIAKNIEKIENKKKAAAEQEEKRKLLEQEKQQQEQLQRKQALEQEQKEQERQIKQQEKEALRLENQKLKQTQELERKKSREPHSQDKQVVVVEKKKDRWLETAGYIASFRASAQDLFLCVIVMILLENFLRRFLHQTSNHAAAGAIGCVFVPFAGYHAYQYYQEKSRYNESIAYFNKTKNIFETSESWDCEIFMQIIDAIKKHPEKNKEMTIALLDANNPKVIFLKKLLSIFAILTRHSNRDTLYKNGEQLLKEFDAIHTGLKNAAKEEHLFLSEEIDHNATPYARLNNFLFSGTVIKDRKEAENAKNVKNSLETIPNVASAYLHFYQQMLDDSTCYGVSCKPNAKK